eukprot:202066_1
MSEEDNYIFEACDNEYNDWSDAQIMDVYIDQNSINNTFDHNYNLEILKSKFKQLDQIIGLYYYSVGNNNYFDTNGMGKFLAFATAEGYVDAEILIDDEIGSKSSLKNTSFIYFDFEAFPFPDDIDAYLCNITDRDNSVKHREKAIFYIIQHCYIHSKPPTTQYIMGKLLEENSVPCESEKKISNEYRKNSKNNTTNDTTNSQQQPESDIHDIGHKDEKLNTDKVSLLNVEQIEPTCINKELIHCEAFKRLKISLDKYNKSTNNNVDSQSIQSVMNDFLHLFQQHNNDHQFELIANELGICEIKTCQMFRRNHRNRENSSENDMIVVNDKYILYQQIFDKIHCYYHHTFDIGYRLTSDEKLLMVYDQNDKHESNHLTNNQLLRIHAILQPKITKTRSYRRKPNKYQLDLKDEGSTPVVSDKYYNFGTQFRYDELTPSYSSIKQECISNPFTTITVQQFNNEYQKALIYFNTVHCKQNYHQLTAEHLLSALLYCNFTKMSNEFSKTYRKIKPNETKEEIGVRHSNFYWLAKFVYETVNWFGSSERVPSLYHGIGNECILPTISESFRGVKIYGPLSTSSSIAVAANFAKYNSGLIIMFDDHDYANGSRCFSCNWLSDYSHEQEYLFLQNRYGYFKITNIIHAASGIEFAIIINALRILLTLINGAAHGLSPWNHILRKISKRSVDDMNENDRSELNDTFGIKCEHDKIIMCQLIEKMIQHQLVMVNRDKYIQCKYVQFVDLHHYGGTLLNAFCSNQTDISLDQDLFEKSGFSNLIIYFWLDYEVNSKLLKDLFPNCKTFAVCNSLKNYNNE